MNYSEYDAAMICAHLLRQGYVRKNMFPQLELNENLMRNVKDRLSQVGMDLVLDSYSSFYAVRLTKASQDQIEESNNLGLKNNEIAMLVILWSKLIFPKRLVHDPEAKLIKKVPKEETNTPLTPNNGNGVPEQESEQELPETNAGQTAPESAAARDRLFVKVHELYAEFGKHFGNKTVFKSILSRLSNLKFIHMHNEVISEGVFLDLLIDGTQMGNEIKKSALAYKLAGLIEEEEVEEWTEEEIEEQQDFLDLSDELVISETDTGKKVSSEQEEESQNH